MRVQRLAGETSVSYTVIGEDALPVAPIEAYLVHLVAAGKSPSTVKAYAQDLKDLFMWLEQRGQDFAEAELDDLTQFVAWLRRPVELRRPDVFVLPGSPSALDAATLLRKRAALAGFYRFHAVHGSAKAVLGGTTPGARYATGDYLPMLVAHTMGGPVEHSPLRLPAGRKKRPRELSDDEVSLIQNACLRLRDPVSGDPALRVRAAHRRGARTAACRPGSGRGGGARRAAGGQPEPGAGEGDEGQVGAGPWLSVPALRRLPRHRVRRPGQRLRVRQPLARGPRGGDDLQRGRRPGAATAWADGHRRLTWHALRHTYATRLLRSGVPIEVVAVLLGHESTETTKSIYSHLDLADYRRFLTASGALDGDPAA